MTKPLSSDLRERLVAAVEDGMSCREAAEQFGVAPSSAVKVVGGWRRTGSYEPRPQGGDRRSGRIEAFAVEIIGWIRAEVDMTLAEMAERLAERHGESSPKVPSGGCSRVTTRRLKKSSCASERERPDVALSRQVWSAGQASSQTKRLVFVDETGASTKMARLYGRSPKSTRCEASIPHGHWKTRTFVGGLREGDRRHRWCSTGPWMAWPSTPGSTALRRRWRLATSSSWTICRHTSPSMCDDPSRRRVPSCATRRLISPISTRSRMPSPSSRRF